MAIDFSGEHGHRALQELESRPVVWITTTGAGNVPQPNLVWFVYSNNEVLIYSRPDAKRLNHIRQNPHVSLNFNTDPEGHQQTVLHGTIIIDESLPTVLENAAYASKYGDRIREMGGTLETFSAEYTVKMRVQLTSMRGF